MKKYITLLIAFSFLTSCSYKEDNTFEQKASNRTTSVIESYKNILEGHDGYWVLSYYPGVTRSFGGFPAAPRSLGGYTFVVKFKDGKVTASSEISNTNAEEESYYTYSITEGPTISFDTYNSILDHFRFVSAVFTNARGGDIEFIFLKEENGVVTLRGRTSNNLMTLTKLTGDREALLNKLRENTQALNSKGLNPITVQGTQVDLTLFPSYRQLVFSYGGNTVQRPFTITEKGIKFYEPVSINNVTLSELYFNEDKTALVSPDGNFSSALVASPLTITNSTVISFEDSKASPYLIEKYEAAKGWAENIFSWGTLSKKVKLAPMAGNEGENATGIEIVETTEDGSGWSGYYLVDFVGVAGAPTQVKFLSKGPQDSKENYLYFFKDPAIWLAEILVRSAPYTVENHSSEYYRLISVGDANVWFLVKK